MTPEQSFHVDENIIVEEDDWIERLQEPFRSELLATIRDLEPQRLQRFPLPISGPPYVGHEARALYRYLRGQNALFTASALSNVYRLAATPRMRLVYRAFVLAE